MQPQSIVSSYQFSHSDENAAKKFCLTPHIATRRRWLSEAQDIKRDLGNVVIDGPGLLPPFKSSQVGNSSYRVAVLVHGQAVEGISPSIRSMMITLSDSPGVAAVNTSW